MMHAGSDRYVTLMTSLPRQGRDLFSIRQTPISRYKLESRLKMLDEDHAQSLSRIERVLQWRYQPLDGTDAEIVVEAKRLMSDLHSPPVRDAVQFRLEFRTVVAALRRRRRGERAPRPGVPWGYGRWVAHIERYWTEPGYRLERIFPWVHEAHRLMNADETQELERLLLGVVWEHLNRVGEEHYFDFEAVVMYVLRWHLIDRWTRYDGSAAVSRFREMIESGLGAHANVFA